MDSAEILLRAAGITVTLLMAVLLLRDAGRSLVGRLAAVFSIGVASYLLCSAPAFQQLPAFVHFPVLVCFA